MKIEKVKIRVVKEESGTQAFITCDDPYLNFACAIDSLESGTYTLTLSKVPEPKTAKESE